MTAQRKLVRDKIPGIIRAEGREPEITIASGDALLRALEDKLGEELAEFRAAPTTQEKHAELADLLEVVMGMAEQSGLAEDDLFNLRRQKRDARGGFSEGYIYELPAKKDAK